MKSNGLSDKVRLGPFFPMDVCCAYHHDSGSHCTELWVVIGTQKKLRKGEGHQKQNQTKQSPPHKHKESTNKCPIFYFFSSCHARSRLGRSSKRLVVGQLFSGCKRTGEMQKVRCLPNGKTKNPETQKSWRCQSTSNQTSLLESLAIPQVLHLQTELGLKAQTK